MLINKAFRLRAYPSAEQVATHINPWSDSLRFLWNLALEQRLIAHDGKAKCERRYPTAFDQINELTALRAELPWLAAVPRNVCTQLLVELARAWQRCFAKVADAPHWKRKGKDVVNLCEPHPRIWRLDIDERDPTCGALHFPKLGPMRVVVHRPLEGTRKTCTLVRDGDQWFASIVCEIEIQIRIRASNPSSRSIAASCTSAPRPMVTSSTTRNISSPRSSGLLALSAPYPARRKVPAIRSKPNSASLACTVRFGASALTICTFSPRDLPRVTASSSSRN